MPCKLPPNDAPRVWRIPRRLRELHRNDDGATSLEYFLILVVIVMPIGLMYPVFINWARIYGSRLVSLMHLPYP